MKAAAYEEMLFKITEVITDLYNKNAYLLEGNLLNEGEKKYYQEIELGMGSELATGAIRCMAGFMQRYYGQKVIIILDEYDTPMQDAWVSGYWEETVRFLAACLTPPSRQTNTLSAG